jgi:hypothetical protein
VRADALGAAGPGAGTIAGEVSVVERLGDAEFAHFRTPWGQELVARFPPGAAVRVRDRVEFALTGKVHFFDAQGRVLRNAAMAGNPVAAED